MLNRLHAMFTAANYAYMHVFEGVADLGDHLVFRYILPKHFCVDLVNKLLLLLLLLLDENSFENSF